MHPAALRRVLQPAVDRVLAGECSLDEAEQQCRAELVAMKAAEDPEPWAEADANLPIIESLATLAVLGLWRQLRDRIIALLGLVGTAAETFTFNPNDLAAMVTSAENFAQAVAATRGPLTNAQVAAWLRGHRNAAADLSIEWNSDAVQQAIRAQLARVRASYAERGLSLVRGGVARTFRKRIVASLLGGEFDGQNPVHVGRQLRQRFGAGEYNWERLARSEVAMAQSGGKKALMREQGIEKYNYVTAEDNRVSKICRSLAAGGPYLVADPAAPEPVRDSHPNCRCTTTPVLPE